MPVQRLVFSLVQGPKGLSLTEGGVLGWTPSFDQGGTTNRVEVSVSDGVARTQTSFLVVVRPFLPAL